MIIYAASTQRTIGLTLAIIVAAGFALYVLINIRTGRKEIGAEVELAPNRKKYFDDEILETRRLDIALTAGVAVLIIIALCLPLYWLGEPGRQEGYENLTGNQFASRGGEAYEELCAQCHGAAGVGGQAAFRLSDVEVSKIGRWNITRINAVSGSWPRDCSSIPRGALVLYPGKTHPTKKEATARDRQTADRGEHKLVTLFYFLVSIWRTF